MSSPMSGTKGVPRADREEQILAVAIDEFAERGYAGASMVTIATAAGISKPLIYQYFGSKDGLYLACLRHVAEGLLDRLAVARNEEIDSDESVVSRVRTLGHIFEALEPHRHAWRLLYDSTMPTTGEIGDAARSYQASTSELAFTGLGAVPRRARACSTPADASALTALWMGLVNSVVSWWIEHPAESADAMTQRCYRLLAAVALGALTMTGLTAASRVRGSSAGRYVDVDGHRIYVQIQDGTGPTIVFLHGYPSSSYDWRLVLPGAGRPPDPAVRLPRLRAVGEAGGRRYSLLRQADLVESLVAAQTDGPVLIVGHDMGTSVANELMARDIEGSAAVRDGRDRAVQRQHGAREGAPDPGAEGAALAIRAAAGAAEQRAGLPGPVRADLLRRTHPLTADEAADQWALLAHLGGHRIIDRLTYYLHERVEFAERWHGALRDWPGRFELAWAGRDPVCVEAVLQAVLRAAALRAGHPLAGTRALPATGVTRRGRRVRSRTSRQADSPLSPPCERPVDLGSRACGGQRRAQVRRARVCWTRAARSVVRRVADLDEREPVRRRDGHVVRADAPAEQRRRPVDRSPAVAHRDQRADQRADHGMAERVGAHAAVDLAAVTDDVERLQRAHRRGALTAAAEGGEIVEPEQACRSGAAIAASSNGRRQPSTKRRRSGSGPLRVSQIAVLVAAPQRREARVEPGRRGDGLPHPDVVGQQ